VYARLAPWYDLATLVPEVFVLRRLRRALLLGVRGDVLEVAVGTGANLRHVPREARLVALDPSPEMLLRALWRARRLGREVPFVRAAGEALPFAPATFDAVLTTLTVCTFADPLATLRELRRVARPGGRVLLLEHGLSDRPWLRRRQRRRAAEHLARFGCHLDREAFDLVREAGLGLVREERHGFGVLRLIEARA
jgi:ubiquinone/menaquinone biosynthesis C-methylase UbiE